MDRDELKEEAQRECDAQAEAHYERECEKADAELSEELLKQSKHYNYFH